MSKYSIVIPVFNEDPIINETYKRLKETMDKTKEDYELIFVNDGSKDSTHDLIYIMCKKDSHVKLLEFSRNFGHQIAISAGLDHAEGDAVVVIDADLQDPPETILEMIKKWKEGYEVVHGKRIKREGEPIFRKLAIKIYYRLLKNMTNHDIPVDVGDFRLIDKKICTIIRNLPEKNRYLRGLVSWTGFKQTNIEYIRHVRAGGESKYPLSKLISLALSGITSFTYKPLRFASYIGFILSLLSFMYLVYAVYSKFVDNVPIIGWTSIIVTNAFFYGIVLIMLGIIGEYIGRIYEETKGRPLYILKEKIGFNS